MTDVTQQQQHVHEREKEEKAEVEASTFLFVREEKKLRAGLTLVTRVLPVPGTKVPPKQTQHIIPGPEFFVSIHAKQ